MAMEEEGQGENHDEEAVEFLSRRAPVRQSGRPAWATIIFLVPAMASSLFGYDIGGVSGVLRALGDAGYTPVQLGGVASLSMLGALLSSAFALGFGDWLGRRRELVAAGFFYTIGSFVEAYFTLDVGNGGVVGLYVGRVLYGLGIGFAMHASPLYIGELAPADQRGRLVALKELVIVTGILVGYLAGAAAHDHVKAPAAWVLGGGALISIPLVFTASFLAPDSPRWLVLRGQLEAQKAKEGVDTVDESQWFTRAKQVALELSGGDEVAADDMIANTIEALEDITGESNEAGRGAFRWMSDSKIRKALKVGLGLVLFQQVTGQPSILYYANKLFGDFGFGYKAAVGLGLFKMIVTLSSASMVENVGRRRLLLAGTMGMTMSLVGLTAVFVGGSTASSFGLLQKLCLLGFVFLLVGSYQIGFGPVTWLMLSEIFPLKIRAAAMGIAAMTNFGTNWIIAAVYAPVRDLIGIGPLYACFTTLAALSVIFVHTQVPETKGLTLEEIQAQL